MAKRIAFEKIETDFGSSFTISKFDELHANSRPRWHSHPELELVYIREGSGKRHVGTHISQYDDGDLILLGPNLPHYGFTDRFGKDKFEIVLHFREDFLGEQLFKAVEFENIRKLLIASRNGLSFYGNVKEEIGERLESIFYMTPFEKVIEVLKILHILSRTEEVINLNAIVLTAPRRSTNIERMDLIFNYVQKNFQHEIPLDQMAELTFMTVPSFCRFFKAHTNKTFIEFLQQYRVTHACKLLVETNDSITDISFECGFNNFSHFNKTFKKITGKSPSAYRKEALLSIAR